MTSLNLVELISKYPSSSQTSFKRISRVVIICLIKRIRKFKSSLKSFSISKLNRQQWLELRDKLTYHKIWVKVSLIMSLFQGLKVSNKSVSSSQTTSNNKIQQTFPVLIWTKRMSFMMMNACQLRRMLSMMLTSPLEDQANIWIM